MAMLDAARNYTLTLLADLSPDDYFRPFAISPLPGDISKPGELPLPTHIAWQVGHLAMAEYGLALFRQRGRAEIDGELMTSRFRKQYSKGTVPNFDRSAQPPLEEILATFHRVHRQAMEEVATFSDSDLDQGVGEPYAGYPTRLGALLFCSQHEMLHAGQIGLLRRLIGKPQLR